MSDVIVVDHRDQPRRYLQAVLETRALRTRGVPDGWWLLTALDIAPADVVVIDLDIPYANSFEAVRRVRARFPAIAIVGLSAASLNDPVVRTFKHSGINVVLHAPIEETSLLDIVEAFLSPLAAAA